MMFNTEISDVLHSGKQIQSSKTLFTTSLLPEDTCSSTNAFIPIGTNYHDSDTMKEIQYIEKSQKNDMWLLVVE